VLADEHHRAIEKGTSDTPAIQQQFALQRLKSVVHAGESLQHACAHGNPVYTSPMKATLIIAAAALFFAVGCTTTDTGHREYLPGKGWVDVK